MKILLYQPFLFDYEIIKYTKDFSTMSISSLIDNLVRKPYTEHKISIMTNNNPYFS